MEDFASVYPAHVRAFATLLIKLRADFGGDLDAALLLAVIGERHFSRRTDPETPTLETLGATQVDGSRSVNAYSLAQYTGIPRETARRKLARLIELGWVRVDAQGDLVPTMRAAQDLRESTDAAIAFLGTVRSARGVG